MPVWIAQVEQWIRSLRERNLRTRPLLRSKKERPFGADLIFMALPTNCRPSENVAKVPSWNKWNDTVPFNFFKAAAAILTDNDFLALFYSIDLKHAACVLDGLKEVPHFQHIWSWSVVMDRPVFYGVQPFMVNTFSIVFSFCVFILQNLSFSS